MTPPVIHRIATSLAPVGEVLIVRMAETWLFAHPMVWGEYDATLDRNMTDDSDLARHAAIVFAEALDAEAWIDLRPSVAERLTPVQVAVKVHKMMEAADKRRIAVEGGVQELFG